jgi:hypothetical protein
MSCMLIDGDVLSKFLNGINTIQAIQRVELNECIKAIQEYCKKHDPKCNYDTSYYIDSNFLFNKIVEANHEDYLHEYSGRRAEELKEHSGISKYNRNLKYLTSEEFIYKKENIGKLAQYVNIVKFINYNTYDKDLREALTKFITLLNSYIIGLVNSHNDAGWSDFNYIG